MKHLTLICIICAALTGCATTQIEYRAVPVPVPVPCAAPIPQEPNYPLVSPNDDIYEAAKKRVAEIEQRKAYIIELKAAQFGCGEAKNPR